MGSQAAWKTLRFLSVGSSEWPDRNQCFIRKWHHFDRWDRCSGSMLRGCTSKQVLPLHIANGMARWREGRCLHTPFTQPRLWPFHWVFGTRYGSSWYCWRRGCVGLWGWAAQKSLRQRERASGPGKESQGSDQVWGNQCVRCGC